MTDDAAQPVKVLSPAKLAHVVLRTNNFHAMVAFYKTFLGAEASLETSFAAFLTYDDEHHRIAIVALPNTQPRPAGSAGLDHIAFTYNTLSDLLQSYQQRKANGISPVWAVNHGPTTSIYWADPDGNKIETQVDNFATPDEASRFLQSEQMRKNPIGVDFDPDELVGKLAAGVAEEELMARPDIGERTMPPAGW